MIHPPTPAIPPAGRAGRFLSLVGESGAPGGLAPIPEDGPVSLHQFRSRLCARTPRPRLGGSGTGVGDGTRGFFIDSPLCLCAICSRYSQLQGSIYPVAICTLVIPGKIDVTFAAATMKSAAHHAESVPVLHFAVGHDHRDRIASLPTRRLWISLSPHLDDP